MMEAEPPPDFIASFAPIKYCDNLAVKALYYF